MPAFGVGCAMRMRLIFDILSKKKEEKSYFRKVFFDKSALLKSGEI